MDTRGGARKGSGRKPGAKNKRTIEVQKMLDELGCNPIEGMVQIAKEAMVEAAANPDFKNKKEALKLAADLYTNLAKYYAPQLKAVEVTGDANNPLEFVQRIERTIVSPEHPDS